MLIVPPVPYRSRRGRIKAAGGVPQPPVGPLVLAGATYDDDLYTLTLVFDRAIDISGIVGTAIVVNDGESHYLTLTATGGAVLVDPVTVRLSLDSVGDSEESGILLEAGPGNGIVAAHDSGTWPGATDVALPFP